MEEFRFIDGYNGLYQVSNLGRIKSLNWKCTGKEVIMCPSTYNGYSIIGLSKKGKKYPHKVHRLVLETFIGKSNLECNHKDGNKQNNKLDNLEWLSRKDNILHRYRTLGYKGYLKGKYGKDNPRSRMIGQYDKEGNLIKKWYGVNDVYRELKIQVAAVCRLERKTAGGFVWKYIAKIEKH